MVCNEIVSRANFQTKAVKQNAHGFFVFRYMKLDKNRKKIDRVDARILVLLQRRADIVREIGELKREDGRPIVDRKRENEVIRRVAEYNGGLLPEQAVTRIYRAILRESRQMQRDLADHVEGVRP